MVALGTALGAWATKKVLPQLTLKNIGKLLLLLMFAYGCYKVYEGIYDRGARHQAAEDKVLIDSANKARDEAQRELSEYKTSYNDWVATSKEAAETMQAQHREQLAAIQAKLAAAEERARKKKKDIIHVIPEFIPSTADPELSVGFVSLFNLSLEAGETAGDSGPPADLRGNVERSSGIKLSEFAAVAVENNIEAVQRGIVIESWQEWYEGAKDSIDEAKRKSAEAIPRLPTPDDKQVPK